MKYTVRVEVKVIGCEVADIKVEATSHEEAKLKAKAVYDAGEVDLDFWVANEERSLSESTMTDWSVSESI